jgi:hypothetical protein
MRARATPAASALVAVQVREYMASLADSPALDELPDALPPERGQVPLEFVVPGHETHGSALSRTVYVGIVR